MSIRQPWTWRQALTILGIAFAVHFAVTFLGMPTWASSIDKLYRPVGNAPASFSTTEVVVSSCVQVLSWPLLFTRQLEHAAFFWSDLQSGIFPQIVRLAANSLIHAILFTGLALLWRTLWRRHRQA